MVTLHLLLSQRTYWAERLDLSISSAANTTLFVAGQTVAEPIYLRTANRLFDSADPMQLSDIDGLTWSDRINHALNCPGYDSNATSTNVGSTLWQVRGS